MFPIKMSFLRTGTFSPTCTSSATAQYSAHYRCYVNIYALMCGYPQPSQPINPICAALQRKLQSKPLK